MNNRHLTTKIDSHMSILDKLEQAIISSLKFFLVTILGAMSVLIIYQVFCRYILNSPSSISEELLRYSLVWLGLLGSALCFFKGMHMNLPILLENSSEKLQGKIESFSALIILSLGAVLFYGGILGVSNTTTTSILKIPMGILQIVLVISGGLIMFSQFLKMLKLIKFDKSNLFILIVYLILFLLFGVLYSYFMTVNSVESYISENLELISFIVLFISFFTFLILGIPIAVGLAFSGLLTLSLQIEFSNLVGTVGENIFSSLDNFGFLALPFFILAGNIMNQGGIARRLIDFAMLLAKRVPGSLWQTNIVANMLFGCLSGSAIASATAIGGIISPMAKEKKYDMPFSTAVNAASSICGMLIPPTGVFIVYSLITGGKASISALFLAGYIPGMIMGLSVMIVAYRYAKKNNYPTSKSTILLKTYWNVTWRAIPSLLLIFVVIGGIIGGIFTAIEASGIAVLYSLILSIFYRTISIKSMIEILYESVLNSSVILFLIACSSLMSWSMTFAYIPDTVAEFLTNISDNIYIILLLINLTLLIVGVFMDMSPALLIFTPILFPIVTSMGVDPVHFGVIMVYNLSIGVVTPPVGTVLFVSCSISGQKITSVIRPLLPIFFVQFIGLILVTYLPELSLWLPKFFGLM